MRLPPHFDPEALPNQELVLHNAQCAFLATPNRLVLPGSGLIVPLEPRATVLDLTPEEWMATFELLHEAKEWIDERYTPDGYNIGWNNGRVCAGAEVVAASGALERRVAGQAPASEPCR
ncbi:MAG: hypothetical protein WD273_11595 [Trueperaceae bacterium]